MSKRNKHWGNRLSSILKEKEISLRGCASIAKVSPSVISSWLSGASPSDFLAVKRLCNELDISFTWLLTGEKENKEHKATLAELYEEVPYFDGLARIRIDRLIPTQKEDSF